MTKKVGLASRSARGVLPNSQSEIEAAIRTEIGHELHDGPLQIVVGAKMLAESFAARLQRGHALVPDELNRLADLLGRAVSDTRAIILETRLSRQRTGTWTDSLRDWIALQAIGATEIVLQVPPELDSLPREHGDFLFQVSREAIQNALRHADASRILVTAQRMTDRLCLDIRDDGIGFNPEQLPAGHFGVRSLKERTLALGGECSIQSSAQGTEIHIVIPDVAR